MATVEEQELMVERDALLELKREKEAREAAEAKASLAQIRSAERKSLGGDAAAPKAGHAVAGAAWSKLLLRHGGSGTVAGVAPAAVEAAARRRGEPRATALLGCVADIYEGADRAIDAQEFSGLEELCG